jgi:outer membrane immunogenic protein
MDWRSIELGEIPMKHLWLAGAALLGLTVPTMAADMYLPPPPPAALWSGCYGGGNLGGVQGDSNFNWTPNLGGFPISGPGLQEYGPVTLHSTGFTGGAQVGCNYQSGGFAWGGEADFGYTGVSATRNVTSVPLNPGAGISVPPFNVTESAKSDFLATIRGRLGIVSGAGGTWFLYVTGGGAFASVQFNDSACFPLGEGGCNTAASTTTKFGWTAGAGAEWAFAPGWSVKAEYLFANLGNVNYVSINSLNTSATILHDHTLTENLGRLGVNWHF